jgi:EAL domain-containing protein (putative c-di-GMP-specific phosphodiesterase class I)/GGDEF domain-containing protein
MAADEGLSASLRAERDRFVGFAFAAADALVELAGDHTIAYAAGAIQGLSGRAADALIGEQFLDLVTPDDRRVIQAVLDAASDSGRFGPVTVGLVHPGGEVKRLAISGTRLAGGGARTYLALSAIRLGPAPDAPSAEDRDPDTGLLNKDALANIATEAMKATGVQTDPYNMTFLELDGLGDLKARIGGDGADAFMSEITAHVQAHSVNGDSAGHIAGDKYGFVHEAGLDASALEVAFTERTRSADPAGKGVAVEVATVTLDGDSDVSEEDSAKALLYTINRFSDERGDFTISDLSDGYKLMLDDTVDRVASFKSTLANSEFDVAYQPIVYLGDRTVHHFEALVRLRDKSGGGSPFAFITFAEEVGVIGDFDLAMAHRVIAKIKQAKKNGDILKVAVNLSGRSLESPAFIDKLHRILQSCRDIRDQLMFEVTESAKITNLEQTNAVLQSLRRAGHHVCLDDFGAGAAAFQYLRALEVDYVKIDGVYVREALTTPNGKPFLRAMAGLCSEIGIQTVAEMVETEEEAKFLFEAKVQFGQGYLFGKPAQGITSIRGPAARKAV